MSGKRIYELTEKSNLENDYFMALDKSGTANAQKVNVSKILNPINNISGSADEYSSTKAYAVGDLVIHDNKLYKCTTACSAAAWSTNQGYFTQSTLTTELTNVKSSLTTLDFITIQGGAGTYGYAYKRNGVVQFTINNRNNITVNAESTLFQLPVGYRPVYEVQVASVDASTAKRFIIGTGGNVSTVDALSNFNIRFTATFLANE